MIFCGDNLPQPPDSLTIPQLILDQHHPLRPIRKGTNPWLIDDVTGRGYGLEEIRARVQGLASGFKTVYNIQEDDVVCVFSPNHIDYPIVVWATHRLGAIITGANPTFGVEELVYQLATTKAKFLITHRSSQSVALSAAQKVGISPSNILYFSGTNPLEPSIGSLIDEYLLKPLSYTERKLDPGEGKTKIALLCFSSGTTGRPKAVLIPHYAVISNVLMMAKHHRVADDQYDRFRPGDVSDGAVPMFHVYGMVLNLHVVVFSGMTLVVTAKFNYEQMLKNIVRYKITHLFLVPPQVVLFCKHPATKNYDLSSIRWVMIGAAPLSSEVTLQFQKVIPQAEITQGYGMTEIPTTVIMTPISQRLGTPGSAGRLMPGVRAKIVKPDGSLAEYDEPGELIVTGHNVTLGYLDNPQATKETFVDGWVRTGDEVLIKLNGDVFVVDRLKEIFKVRGFQVAPAELEGHLLDHPDVRDVGVIGIPDEFSGEVPMAFIVMHAQAIARVEKDPEEADRIKQSLIKFVADAKVQYKWLAGGIEFVDEIPKNPSGKILRRVLRDKAKEILAQRK